MKPSRGSPGTGTTHTVPRALGILGCLVALLIILNGGPAFAASWVKTSLPNVSDRPEDPGLDGTAPYTLRWPNEGTTESGSNDCDPTPPWKTGRRARSELLTGVKGIQKTGEFWKAESSTSADGGNHLAFFFHQDPCFGGGAEFGFTRKLNEGNATLYFYQCGNCNIPGELYTRTAVWSYAGSDRMYRINLQTDGDFEIKVFLVEPGGSKQLVHAQVVTRVSWMPNMYGASGYVTANAHTGDAATPDSYVGSYNQVDKVKYLH
ncbi:MAG: hypothetical protein H0W94_03610 [Actinobacteria bacterium]|nr:hypothetical protein [Actinomycetota bacterium]